MTLGSMTLLLSPSSRPESHSSAEVRYVGQEDGVHLWRATVALDDVPRANNTFEAVLMRATFATAKSIVVSRHLTVPVVRMDADEPWISITTSTRRVTVRENNPYCKNLTFWAINIILPPIISP